MSAPAMTYSSLVEDVKNYCERTDDAAFIAQIPRFIMYAENRIAAEIRGLGLLRFVTGSLSNGSPILSKPERWRETALLTVTVGGQVETLQNRQYQYLRTFWPDISVTGMPRYYGDYDYEHFFVVPVPDAAYTFEMAYYERPVPLSDEVQTNWTTQYAPQLLLYATLLECQPWLKNDQRLALFQQGFDRASQALGNEAIRRLADSSSSRREG